MTVRRVVLDPEPHDSRYQGGEEDGYEDICDRCGGDGYILAADGDGSDWGEDTYAGPMDAVIKCRHCNGGKR